ncbi:MAG: M48 family metalloprotease [Pseudomonadota bacterium]
MKRRRFAAGAAAALLAPLARADASLIEAPRFTRPDLASDEGGLWAIMDREESKLRRSPFVMRDAAFHDYVQDIACRLGGAHCPDVRVYLVRNRYFNASMAPNGMMQVWSGLMLRVDNEAQLAAVLGHEVGHYLARHSVDALREAKSRSAFAMGMAMFGVVGLIGQLAAVAGMYSYSRDNERKADEMGLQLMSKAGYDPREAAKVWDNLMGELKADPDTDPTKKSPLFATHPPGDERRATLGTLAAAMPAGATFEQRWLERTAPYRREWLDEEIKRGATKESLALFTRLMARSPQQADYAWARAEVYRARGAVADIDAAILDYRSAIAIGAEPAEVHRGLGLIYRDRKQLAEARASFGTYLKLSPDASDSSMISSYIEELNT